MSMFGKQDHVSAYLTKRAEIGQRHSNDRVTDAKKWADAELRGRLGCDRANDVIAAIDSLRSRGY